jgi:hypothetical protein
VDGPLAGPVLGLVLVLVLAPSARLGLAQRLSPTPVGCEKCRRARAMSRPPHDAAIPSMGTALMGFPRSATNSPSPPASGVDDNGTQAGRSAATGSLVRTPILEATGRQRDRRFLLKKFRSMADFGEQESRRAGAGHVFALLAEDQGSSRTWVGPG